MSGTFIKELLLFVAFTGVFGLAFAFVKSRFINSQDPGNKKMTEISGYIREGAMAFLAREYKVLSVFALIVAGLLVIGYWGNHSSSPLVAVSFLLGALSSALAGFFGMRMATAANVRTTQSARSGLNKALHVAFSGGVVMGMSVVGLALFGLSSLVLVYFHSGWFDADWTRILAVASGFSLGASSIALFARVGGGIFTKAADVGADLVGKLEAGIPEDDPRNPAVIADNVGDNVGDVAGMGADLFESYVGSIVGAMVLAATASQVEAIILPLLIAAAGVIVSALGTAFVRTSPKGNPQTALNIGTFGAAGIMVVVTAVLAHQFLPDGITLSGVTYSWFGVFGAVITGLVGGTMIGLSTEYYTSESRSPARQIAKDSQTGAATNVIGGLALGMKSTAIPVIILATVIMGAYGVAGLYGIAMAALGMLSTTGIQLAVDAYGPIADNAGGIAEMAGLDKKVRDRTDKLDAVGNTTAAIGKGFAISSAALTALALFSAYQTTAGIESIDVSNPTILAGVLVGAMLPFVFSSMAMTAVGQAAFDMIKEVRRQFKEIPGLMKGKAKADHNRCVDIATSAAIKRMVAPGLMAILVPVAVGFYDKEALAGLLVGVTVSGVLLALFMANAGGAWDNAKKHIEAGAFGGKGSDSHKAAVVGDTIGDPFKDTSGPSLNILIKLMSIVALILAPMLV